jgi:hypothetical protein
MQSLDNKSNIESNMKKLKKICRSSFWCFIIKRCQVGIKCSI